jgi:hypothetical protein
MELIKTFLIINMYLNVNINFCKNLFIIQLFKIFLNIIKKLVLNNFLFLDKNLTTRYNNALKCTFFNF